VTILASTYLSRAKRGTHILDRGRGVKLITHLKSSVEFKNARSYTSNPQYSFMAWCSVKTQEHLYLYIYTHVRGWVWQTRRRGSSVSIVTRLRTRQGFDSRQGEEFFFLFATVSRLTPMISQPPIQWVPDAISPGIKWQKSETDHSPPSSAEGKKCMELYLRTRYVITDWYSVKHSA
jgi:hypothetical protein